jgi:hypothetical protein
VPWSSCLGCGVAQFRERAHGFGGESEPGEGLDEADGQAGHVLVAAIVTASISVKPPLARMVSLEQLRGGLALLWRIVEAIKASD